MIELIPAIMPKSYDDLKEKASLVSEKVLSIQFDIMDGRFVPEKTWPYLDSEKLCKIDILDTFELDLMVKNASNRMSEWIQTGAHRIIFHIEAEENLLGNLEKYKKELRGIEIGLAVDIETSNDTLELLLPYVNFVQFMGIAKIGYQGEPFDDRVIEKIEKLRVSYPEIIISVDGGVGFESAPKLIQAGANRLVAGSAIFKGDIEENLEKFKGIIK